MSLLRNTRFAAISLVALAACGHDANEPEPPPPPSYAQLATLGSNGFGIAQTNDAHLLVTLIYAGGVERIQKGSPQSAHEGVDVGGTPSVVVTNPAGGTFYIANMAGWVEARSSATGAQLATVPVSDAHALSMSPDGNTLYVAGSSGYVYARSAGSLASMATIAVPGGPWGMAYRQSGGSWLYVTARDAGTITEINRATNTVSRVFNIGGRPHGLVISADGSRLYAADNQTHVVKVVDIGTGLVTKQIPLPGAFGLGISPDGRTIYGSGDAGSVAIIDVATGAVVNTWQTGGQARQVVVSANGDTAYFANMNGWIDRVVR